MDMPRTILISAVFCAVSCDKPPPLPVKEETITTAITLLGGFKDERIIIEINGRPVFDGSVSTHEEVDRMAHFEFRHLKNEAVYLELHGGQREKVNEDSVVLFNNGRVGIVSMCDYIAIENKIRLMPDHGGDDNKPD